MEKETIIPSGSNEVVKDDKCRCDCSSEAGKSQVGTEHFITGSILSHAGSLPQISTELSRRDMMEHFKVRLGIGRMNYTVNPGIYAVGKPGNDSPVLVSCNFKLSFDLLRKELGGLNLWIMVLDTKGINVWCAAGKGTFGTAELVNRIESCRLHEVVNHKKIILPQLGAPGIAAHEVKKKSGFSVTYGPIQAVDIQAFLRAGNQAEPEMRRVQFPIKERLLLIPNEVKQWGKYLIPTGFILLLISGLTSTGYSMNSQVIVGIPAIINLILAHLAGTLLGPLLLPWLPGRRFSIKGAISGLILFFIAHSLKLTGPLLIEQLGWFLMIPAYSSFLTMNFTGCSTYTSLSGVKKELATAVPLQLVAGISGALLWLVARFQ